MPNNAETGVPATIFVSYRRRAGAAYAGRIDDRLTNDLGQLSVFIDVDSVSPGDDVDIAIGKAIDRCRAVIVIIGPGWTTQFRAAQRGQKHDWVLTEIQAAINKKKLIIPILVGGARMPKVSDLPLSIGSLAMRQAIELSDANFQHDMGKLVNALRAALELPDSDLNSPLSQPTMQRIPRELPAGISDFTGRDTEIQKILRLITSSTVTKRDSLPIITVFGPPGIGKTTLLIHVAHQVKSYYSGGQLYADLRGADGHKLLPEDVLARFLRTLGVGGSSLPESIDERAALFRSRVADRKILVVLDNASDEQQIRPLLPGCPECAVLISSRKKLGAIPSASLIGLNSLSIKAGFQLLEKIVGTDRVKTDSEASLQIVSFCGMMPLALRIVGTKISSRPTTPLASFAERLSDERSRLTFLVTGDSSVEASMSISYKSLDWIERVAFRRLGALHTATPPIWSLGALLDDNEMDCYQLSEQLSEIQLFELSSSAMDGLGQLRIHDLVRAYAGSRMEVEDNPSEVFSAVERVVSGYLNLAEYCASLLEPGWERHALARPSLRLWRPDGIGRITNTLEALQWFASERENLLALIEQAAASGLFSMVASLASALKPFYDFGSHWDDWEAAFRQALEAAYSLRNSLWEAEAMQGLASLSREKCAWDTAAEYLRKVVSIVSRSSTSSSLQSRIALEEGLIARGKHEWNKAISKLREAGTICRENRDIRGEAIACHYIGDVYRDQGLWKRALPYFESCLKRFAKLGDERWTAITLSDIGLVLYGQREYTVAVTTLSRALHTLEILGDRRIAAYTAQCLAEARIELGTELKLDELYSCKCIYKDIGDAIGESHALISLARVAIRKGDIEQASIFTQEAEGIVAAASYAKGKACCVQLQGQLLMKRGDHRNAIAFISSAYLEFSHISDFGEQERTLILKIECLKKFQEEVSALQEAKTQLRLVQARIGSIANRQDPLILQNFEAEC